MNNARPYTGRPNPHTRTIEGATKKNKTRRNTTSGCLCRGNLGHIRQPASPPNMLLWGPCPGAAWRAHFGIDQPAPGCVADRNATQKQRPPRSTDSEPSRLGPRKLAQRRCRRGPEYFASDARIKPKRRTARRAEFRGREYTWQRKAVPPGGLENRTAKFHNSLGHGLFACRS